MPRRNSRPKAEADNASFLGDTYRFTNDPVEAERRADERRELAKAYRLKLRSHASDWTMCVVPGCRYTVPKHLDQRSDVEFPICWVHAVAAWEYINHNLDDPNFIAVSDALKERRKQIRLAYETSEAQEDADWRAALKSGTVRGDIYFVRVDQLIKVGWSSNLEARLRHYGPTAEVLAHYPGTRNDEMALHKQLTPSRAKGREWYHDDKVIRGFIAEALEKHGRPIVSPKWTEHKGGVTKPARWSA